MNIWIIGEKSNMNYDEIDLEAINIEELTDEELNDLLKDLYTYRENAKSVVSKLVDANQELSEASTQIKSFYKIDDSAFDENNISKMIINIESIISKINSVIVLVDEKISKLNIEEGVE